MGTISVSLPSDGTTADVTDYNTPITTVVNAINGNLDNTNIATGAAIATSKLADDAGITPAKLSASSLSGFVYDFVVSGCVITGTGYGSTLAWSMTAGVVYIGGKQLTVASASGTVTASKDTYFDLLDPGSGTTATLVNTSGNIVTNNAASPSLAANSIRIGIIVSGATIAAAASVNQGQEDRILPIASSVPYAVTDSLGNLICPRDPNRRILGYRQIVGGFASASTTSVQVTGLSVPVIIPTGRKIIVKFLGNYFQGTANVSTTVSIWDGTVSSGTQLTQQDWVSSPINNGNIPGIVEAQTTPSSTSKTYNIGLRSGAAGNAGISAGSTQPAFIQVELA